MSDSGPSEGVVLVVGASGNLGREIVRQLRERRRPVRAMTRSAARAEELRAPGVEVVLGDLLDRASLERACDGVSFVVASAHALLGRGANRPQTVDGAGHRDLIEVAKNAGVGHFVYVSAINVSEDFPVDFFRIKYQTERVLESSGLAFSIVRGAAFMETQNDIAGAQILEKGKAFVFGKGDRLYNYVSVIDVARFVLLGLFDERLRGRTVEVGGPENLTQSQLVDTYERVLGRKVKRTHLPLPLLRVLRATIGTVHPVGRRLLTMGVRFASQDVPFDMEPTLREFPMELTRFETVVQNWIRAQEAKAAAAS